MQTKTNLSPQVFDELLKTLKTRFEKNMPRHQNLEWKAIQEKLESQIEKLASLNEMEASGGEPDVIGQDKNTWEYIFCDCSEESPKGRRSLCYDKEAWESRKEYKPKHNAMDWAAEMGIEILNEAEYHVLQKLGNFDTKTSSWLKTPEEIRTLGGALFGDFRFKRVFIYHNTATSYYAARGFRGILRV